MLLKSLILSLINRVFGLKLSSADLDAFIAFIQMVIGIFGSKDDALHFVKHTTLRASSADPVKAKEVMQNMSQKMGEV